jgi:hypothetical protein
MRSYCGPKEFPYGHGQAAHAFAPRISGRHIVNSRRIAFRCGGKYPPGNRNRKIGACPEEGSGERGKMDAGRDTPGPLGCSEGEKPPRLQQLHWAHIENDPLFAPLHDYWGMYSDTYVHFTPEFIGQQHFDERFSEDGVKTITLRYFASERVVLQSTITICGIHGKILDVFDACFDNAASNDGGWKMLRATFDQLGIDLWKELPLDEEDTESAQSS